MAALQIARRVLRRVRRPERGAEGLPPGPDWPRHAQLAGWVFRPFEMLEHFRRVHGTPFTMRFPHWPAIVSFDDPESIKEIFTGPYHELHAGQANRPLLPIVGSRSLLLLDGKPHLRDRRLLLPPFHGERMTRYGEVMRDVALDDLARWPLDEPFSVQPRTQGITLEIIVRTVFGVDEGLRTGLREALSDLIADFSKPGLMVPFLQHDLGPRSPWGRFVRTRERTDAILHEEIERRRGMSLEGREDIFSMLLGARYEDGRPMSRLELRDELVTMLVAGHETTATALSWAFRHLLAHPSIQAKVHDEIDEVMGEGPIDPDRAKELVYLDAVIKETLRVIPVIGTVGRVLEKPRTIGGFRLPAGTMASPSIWLAHTNPKLYPDPHRFDPTRFLEDKPGPYAFFPFGGGVRRCVGMAFALHEMRIVLATVLQKHRVRGVPGVRYRAVRRSVTMAPANDMPLVIERR